MLALSHHLEQIGDHGGLTFHPHCPVCRSARLAGHLGSTAVVPPRVRVAVVSSVLAGGSLLPAATALASGERTPSAAASGEQAEEDASGEAGGAPVDPTDEFGEAPGSDNADDGATEDEGFVETNQDGDGSQSPEDVPDSDEPDGAEDPGSQPPVPEGPGSPPEPALAPPAQPPPVTTPVPPAAGAPQPHPPGPAGEGRSQAASGCAARAAARFATPPRSQASAPPGKAHDPRGRRTATAPVFRDW